MRQDYSEFQRRNTEIVAVGPESAARLQAWWEKEEIPFPGIPDPKKKVLRELGQEFRWLKFGRMPALLLVDQDGLIRYRHNGKSARDIPENAEILKILDGW